MDTLLVSIIVALIYIVLAPPIITMASEKLNLKAPIYMTYLMEVVGLIFYVIFWVIITVILDLIAVKLDIPGLLIFITVILIPLLTTIPIYLLCKLYYKKEQSREIRLMPRIILFAIMVPLSILIMIINPFFVA